MKNADGNSLSDVSKIMTYDWYGNVISETDPNGEVYGYTYDKMNRITKVTNPNASTVEYTYTVNADTNEVRVKDENGNILKYTYDKFGDEASVTDMTANTLLSDKKRERDKDCGHLLIVDKQYSTQNGYTKTKTYYNCLGQEFMKEILDSSNNVLYSEKMDYKYAIDGLYNRETKTVYGDTAAEAVSTSRYTDKYGNVVKEETTYDDNGSLKTAVTEYTYDFVGNLKTAREPRAAAENWSANEYSARYEYDVAGNVTKETDINGKSIINTYDGLGNLVSVTDKNGNTTNNTYDVLGRLLKEQIPFQKNGTSTVYASNKYYYDANGNLTQEQKANNAVGSSDAYTKTEYEYNWNGQPTKVKGYNGSGVSSCVQYYYDSVGNVLRMYTGNVNGLKVNGLDNLSGTTSNYAVTKYSYDSMNRCVSETDALGQTTANVYDINGNLTQTTDRNGNVLSYSYDGLNQLLQKSSSKTAEDTYTYSYNKKGLRTEMTGGGTDTVYEYDNLGRLTKESLTDGTVKEYTYDINGNRKSFKLTKDNDLQYTLGYTYDKQNRLIGLWENNSLKAQYTYNDDGTLKHCIYGTRTTDYTYNLANLITEINNKKSSTEISKYAYTYYVDGNQKSKSESVAGVNKGTTNYTYDGLGRLKSEALSDKTKSYNYDYYGNRSSMSVPGEGSTSYSYDKNNRLTKQTKADSGVTSITEYWYDPNGNQISSMTVNNSLKDGTSKVGIELAGNSSNMFNEYNSWNQLTSTMQNGKTASYTYNGDGLRMSKTVDGTTTSHIWDGTNIAADVTNGTVTKYIRGLQLISSKTGNSESFYNYNAHGNVVQLTNSSGSIIKQYSYDAFGVEQDKTDNDTNPFRYCGEYFDSEIDSIYLRARYYVPSLGRFMTRDQYWNTDNMIYGDKKYKYRELRTPDINSIMQSKNLYVYCGHNPNKYIDPLGGSWGYDIWNWAEDNIWKGIAVGVSLYGWQLTADLLWLAASGSGNSYIREQGSDASELVKNDYGINYFVSSVIWAYGTSQNNPHPNIPTQSYTIPLSNGDLGAALHNVNIDIDAQQNQNGSWTATVTITDTFDFTELKNPFSQGSILKGFLWAANDIAYFDQEWGLLDSVSVQITYTRDY